MGSKLAKWLRDRRNERGLSRMQLAAKTRGEVSYSSVVKYELGQTEPSARALRALAAPLQVDPVWLLRFAGQLPETTKAESPEPVEEEPRDPKSLVRWLRGDPTLTDDDRGRLADLYERLRRQGG